MAAETGFLGLGKPWAKPIAGVSTVSVTTAGIVGSKEMVLTIWLVAFAVMLLFLGYCIEYKHERKVKTGIVLGAFLLCGIAGAVATHSVIVHQSTEVTNSNTKSASQTTTIIKNSAATQKDDSPAIAGGTGNSISYGASAEPTTHQKAKK